MLSVMEITSRPPMVSPLMADWKEQKDSREAWSQGLDRERRGGGVGSSLALIPVTPPYSTLTEVSQVHPFPKSSVLPPPTLCCTI